MIATGFREARPARQRPLETHASFSTTHAAVMNHENADPMDFPDGSGPRRPQNEPEHIMSSHPEFENSAANDCGTNDRGYADDAAPVPLAYVPDRAAAVISLDSMRDNLHGSVLTNMVNNFEPDDLDVPAFLRKRNEVM